MQNKIPKQKSNYYLEYLDKEILLYHPSNVAIFYFNPTAALIWQLCDGNRIVFNIISLLSEAYSDKTEQDLSDEVHATLLQFEQKGIIEFV